MSKPQTAQTNETTKTPKGKRMGELNLVKTDKPEYIKAEVLATIIPFTIYGASRGKGRFGPVIRFLIAYKEGTNIEKKVFTPTANEDREALMYEVLKNGAITNCRLVGIDIGMESDYWKVIDADEPIPVAESTGRGGKIVSDEDIPF